MIMRVRLKTNTSILDTFSTQQTFCGMNNLSSYKHEVLIKVITEDTIVVSIMYAGNQYVNFQLKYTNVFIQTTVIV